MSEGDLYHGYTRFRSHGWNGYVVQDHKWLTEGDVWSVLERHPFDVIRERPAAKTIRVKLPCGSVFAKLLTPSMDRMTDRFKERMRDRLLGPQVYRVHRVTWQMRRLGLETPVPLLIAVRHNGSRTEQLMITAAIEGESAREVIKREPAIDHLDQLLKQIGTLAANLHRAGFEHGDLLPGNMITSKDGRLVLLDNDRTHRWNPLPFLGYRKRRNLTQLCARLIYRGGHFRHCRMIIDAYLDHTGWGTRKQRIFRAKLMRRIRSDVKRRFMLYGKPNR